MSRARANRTLADGAKVWGAIMVRRNWVVLPLFALTAISCTGEPPVPVGPKASCFYMSGLVAVEEGAGATADQALEGYEVEVEVLEPSDVLVDPEVEEDVDDEVAAAVDEVIDGQLDIISVTADPFDVATLLQDLDVVASPIHAVGQAGHWRLAPGTSPISRPDAALPAPNPEIGEGIIGVVDSGIVAEDTGPDWMSRPRFVLYDDRDVETITDDPRVASHGTFVTSIIRQLAPEYRVSFARAQPVPQDQIESRDDSLPQDLPYVTTELHVAEAIAYLIVRSGMTSEPLQALNLSLGAYLCDPGEDPVMVATLAAMRIWFDAFSGTTVFAAGGNENSEVPFWPAGLSTYPLDPAIDPPWVVRGVGALNQAGDQVVWGSSTNAAAPMKAPTRPWVTDVAPGCDLLGLRGGVDRDGAAVVAWSGSSFATAVNTALVMAGIAPTPPGPPSIYDYNDAELAFGPSNSCQISP